MLGLEERTTRRRLALLLVAACFLPFANGLSGGFTYDDKAIVRDDPRIQSPEDLGQIFDTSYFGGPRGSGSAYRPLLLLSFALEWWIHGKHSVAFHAVNLLLHVAVTLALWRLWRRLRIAPPAALGAALLFAVHPLHVEAVTSLVGRGETLAALLALAYLHLALRLREGSARRGLLLAAAGASSLAGNLTKESAAAAPALAFLLFFWLAEGGAGRRLADALRRGLALWAVSAAALASTFALRAWVLGGWLKPAHAGVFEVENPLAPLGGFPRVANASLLLLRYVGRFALPIRLSADESAWSIRPLSPLSPLALAGLALLAASLLAALLRPRSPAALGWLFFFLAFLPASNLLFPIGTIFAERLAYLPSAGLSLAAAAALLGEIPSLSDVAPARLAAFGLAAALLSARTAMRDTVWWSDEALFSNSVRVSPGSAKNHYNLGYIRSLDGDLPGALASYWRATDLYPGYWDAWAGRGRVEREMGSLDAARRSCERSVAILPSYENGWFNLGLVFEDKGDDLAAREAYRRGLAKLPRSLPLAYRLATVESRLDLPEAGEAWRRALSFNEGSLSTRAGYARWLARRGDAGAARRELARILRSAPFDEAALRTLADLDASRGFFFAEGLARERLFRVTRGSGDLCALLETAGRSAAYRRRFERLRASLESWAPWAFRGCRTVLRGQGPPAVEPDPTSE